MRRPLYINDFAFHCILGGGKDCVFDKLKNGVRGEFTTYDVAGVMRPAATIDPSSLAPVEDSKFDNRVNRLSQAALSQMDASIRRSKSSERTVSVFLSVPAITVPKPR